MADDEKLTEKTENSSPALIDIMEIVDLGGAPLSQKITVANILNSGLITVVGTVVTGNVDAVVTKTSAGDINTGTDVTKAATADAIAGSNIGTKGGDWTPFESGAAVTTGDGTVPFVVPAYMNGMNIIDVIAGVHDKGITGTTDIQIRRRRAGSDVDVLTVKVTLGDEFFANDGTINTSNDDLQTGDILYVDVDTIHSGTAPNGLGVAFSARLP